MIKRIFPVLAFITVTSCVTLPMKYDAPEDKAVVRAVVIHAAAEDVWAAAIKYFSENNVPIGNMEHSSFFIKTRPVDLGTTFTKPGISVELKNDFCDCGKATLEDLYSQVNQIKTSFNIVLLAKSPNETQATTNTFFEGRILGRRDSGAVDYDFELPLKCVSTGVLESRLQSFLNEHAMAK